MHGTSSAIIEQAALKLRQAAESGKPCPPLNGAELAPDDITSGYAIQEINTRHALSQGRKLVGRKIGLTSVAVQQQLGVDQPDFGMLYADMAYGDNDPVPMSRFIQPKIEGEIAFILGRDLDYDHLTHADMLRAIDCAVAALEIVDSRIADWKIRLVDTVADNASSGLYVLGSNPRFLKDVDLYGCAMELVHDGKVVSSGRGSACLGNPLNAALWLARKMVEVGYPLKAGDTILSGALGPMVPVSAGNTYELTISGFGAVRAVFSA